MSTSSVCLDRRLTAAVSFGVRSVLIGVALLVFFHKSGHSLPLLLLSLLLPAGCLLWPHPSESLQRLWQSLPDFAEQGGPSPWRAVLLFVTGPTFFFFLSNERTLTNGDSWPVVPTSERPAGDRPQRPGGSTSARSRLLRPTAAVLRPADRRRYLVKLSRRHGGVCPARNCARSGMRPPHRPAGHPGTPGEVDSGRCNGGGAGAVLLDCPAPDASGPGPGGNRAFWRPVRP